jgi:hypothetical protein
MSNTVLIIGNQSGQNSLEKFFQHSFINAGFEVSFFDFNYKISKINHSKKLKYIIRSNFEFNNDIFINDLNKELSI